MAKKKEIKIEKRGHIVVLDQQWHTIFDGKKGPKIMILEKRLTHLLKEQGKVNTEYKGYKILKNQMMNEIVQGMDDVFNKNDEEKAKKLTTNQKHIKEINTKFEEYEKKMVALPEKIEQANQELLMESMHQCYQRLTKQKKEKDALDAQLKKLHEKMREMAGRKTQMEEDINKLYQFMHNIAGVDAIDQFDQFYFGEDKKE